MIEISRHALVPLYNIPEPPVHGELSHVLVYDKQDDSERTIGVYSANGRRRMDSRNTVIVSLPWSEFVARPDAQDRYRMLAYEYDALVIAVDNPGVDGETSGLTHHQKIGLAHGCFSAITAQQWQAIEATNGFYPDDDITLWGYSLGGSLACSLAATAPEYIDIKRLVIGETGVREQSLGRTMLDFALSNGNWRHYVAENPSWIHSPGGKGLAGRLLTRPAAHLAYPRALGYAPLLGDVSRARERGTISSDTEVWLSAGDQSRVSTEHDLIRAAVHLMELGIKVTRATTYQGEDHSMIGSFPRVAAAARYVR